MVRKNYEDITVGSLLSCLTNSQTVVLSESNYGKIEGTVNSLLNGLKDDILDLSIEEIDMAFNYDGGRLLIEC